MCDFNIPDSVLRTQEEKRQLLLDTGIRIGEHRAFGFLAHRCTAADAELLKRIRDSRDYHTLGYTWKRFCSAELGICQPHADKLIRNLEEFGANFFRMSELVQLSPQTYRLIAASISDDGMEIRGEKVPLTRENRERLAIAVRCLRNQAQDDAAQDPIEAAGEKFSELMSELYSLAAIPAKRPDLLRLSQRMAQGVAIFQQSLRRPPGLQ